MSGSRELFPIVDAPAGLPEWQPSLAVTEESRPGRESFQVLFGLSHVALGSLMAELGQPAYRARQVEEAMYRHWVTDLDEASTLPRALRERLREGGYQVGLPEIVETFRSVDGTERYLIAGLDGQTVETVWMPGGDGSEAAGAQGETEGELPGESEGEFLGVGEGEFPGETEGEFPSQSKGEPPSETKGELPGETEVEFPGESKGEPPSETKGELPGESKREQKAVGLQASPHPDPLPLGSNVILSKAKDLRLRRPVTQLPSDREQAAQRRATICVSSQIGCAVNCQFCLTAKLGIIRNLTAGEIAGQVVAVLKRQGVHLGRDRINLVFMGMGEPFLNYDAFFAALHLLTESVGLAASRMTLSTSGIVPGILRFAQEPVRCKLAISLNASNNVVREQIMPVTRKWNIEAVLAAVRTIPLGPRERITFEYVLLGGVNDRLEHADEVVRLVRGAGFACYVNLIVWNPGPGTPYSQPGQPVVDAFQHRLISQGVTAYIRRPRGRDIYAACGQLKRTTG